MEQETKKEVTETKKEEKEQETKVDVEKVKSQALSEFMKEIGVEDKDALKNIITKAKEEEDKNKTDLERANDVAKQTAKELAQERQARIVAEAKIAAIELGAKTELVNDLVVVAMAKVTKEKDINTVISEIKDSNSGKVYFESKEEEEEEESRSNGMITRKRVTKQTEKQKPKNKEEEKENNHAGSMAERLLASRKQVKKHYFS